MTNTPISVILRYLAILTLAYPLAMWAAVTAWRPAVSGMPAPFALVFDDVEGAPSVDEAERLIVAVTGELQRRGRYDVAASRLLRLYVKVSIGPTEPAAGDDIAREWVRPIVIEWRVWEGEDKTGVGTVTQRNRVVQSTDVWEAFLQHGVPSAVSGILHLADGGEDA